MKIFSLLMFMIFGAGCALGPKAKFKSEHLDSLKTVKTVAIIGFDVTQESTGGLLFDTNLVEKSFKSQTGQGGLQYGDYADEILKKAVETLEQNTNWKVIPVRIVVQNPVYKNIYDKKMNSLFSSKYQSGDKGDLRYAHEGMLLSNETLARGSSERKAILESLHADVVVNLAVDFRLPYDGFHIGSLVGEGSGKHIPETKIHMYFYDRGESSIGTITVQEKQTASAQAGSELKKLMADSFQAAFAGGVMEMGQALR